jgi:hypothetical protein
LIDTLIWKNNYIDYCPGGMPDFSMHLDPEWYGYTRWTYDGPVALANCLWWFDSKFEPSPVDPRPFNGTNDDDYALVQTYGSWDDHDTANVKPFIEDLADLLTTDDTTVPGFPGVYEYGTWMYEMEAGLNTWLTNKGLRDDYTDSVVTFPTFEFLAGELEKSQNLILLIGFYAAPGTCCRYGGHYVNMVGVDGDKMRIGIADPFTAYPPGFDYSKMYLKNDAGNVDYEVYQAAVLDDASCIHDGTLHLQDYFPTWMWMQFESINGGFSQCMSGADSAYAIIEQVLVVCPTSELPPDTCDYYKQGYNDYCPNGMPDFDQKQDNWKSPLTGNQFWSWCGPTAVANCAWWFDSKFEPSPVDPRPFYPDIGSPAPDDDYALVPSYATSNEWDDHDSANVQPLISKLKSICKTDASLPGTNLADLQAGFDSLAYLAGLQDSFVTTLIPGPTYTQIKDSVMASNDVILLLGFYEPEFTGGCMRQGGHYVTMAGVCDEDNKICISDPYFDKNAVVIHGPEVHNDAGVISGPHGTIYHDKYNVTSYAGACTVSPATLQVTDYPSDWSSVSNFVYQNTFNPGIPHGGFTEGNPIIVLVDYALVITPLGGGCDCQPGDADGLTGINIKDITYLIKYKYKGGAAPVPYAKCSGDPNCDCTVNIKDITDLIKYKYKGGSAPCSCEDWISSCGPLQ